MSKGTISKEDLLQALSFAYNPNAGTAQSKAENCSEVLSEQKPSLKFGEAIGVSAADPIINTVKEEVPRGYADDEKLPLQSEKSLSNSNYDPSDFSLSTFLENLLSSMDIPLSVSFLNTYLYRSRLPEEITEDFVQSAQNRSKFSFFLLGCDFKVNLKEKTGAPKCLGNGNTHEDELFKIIQKDMVSLRELQSSFGRDRISEILYEDFLSKYSSVKYKRNLPFIVRNSHALKLERRGSETYISLRKENEQEVRLWDTGFKKLRFACTKELLGYFTTSVPLGILQNCLSFNRDFVIDKAFLNQNYETFELRGVEVILKGVGTFGNEYMAQVPKRQKCSEDEDDNLDNSSVSKPFKGCQDRATQSNIDLAGTAVAEKCCIIVVGNDTDDIPIVYYGDVSSYSNRLAALEKLNKFIDNEIAKLKE